MPALRLDEDRDYVAAARIDPVHLHRLQADFRFHLGATKAQRDLMQFVTLVGEARSDHLQNRQGARGDSQPAELDAKAR